MQFYPNKLSHRADPTRGSPCGLPYRAASAQKKKTPGEAPGVEVWVISSYIGPPDEMAHTIHDPAPEARKSLAQVREPWVNLGKEDEPRRRRHQIQSHPFIC